MSDQPPFCPKHGPCEGVECAQCLELDRARDIVRTTYIAPAEKSERSQGSVTSKTIIEGHNEKLCADCLRTLYDEEAWALRQQVERLTRELADAVIIIDAQKVRIDGEDAERDKERQNWSKETSNLVRAIEGHQRRNAELSMEIERLRAGLREIGSGHIAVSVWDRVNQILEGSPSETKEGPFIIEELSAGSWIRSPAYGHAYIYETDARKALQDARRLRSDRVFRLRGDSDLKASERKLTDAENEAMDRDIMRAIRGSEKAKCEHAQEIGSYCGECPSDIAE